MPGSKPFGDDVRPMNASALNRLYPEPLKEFVVNCAETEIKISRKVMKCLMIWYRSGQTEMTPQVAEAIRYYHTEMKRIDK